MPNASIWTGMGHLGRDAELKNVKGGSVCEFSLAVNDKRTESVMWFRCTVWGNRAESLAPRLTKGTALLVSGDFVAREYKGKKDELRTSLDVRVNTLEFAGGGAGEGRGEARPAPAPAPSPADDDDQIPF